MTSFPKRYLPLIAIVLFMSLAYYNDWGHYFTFEHIKSERKLIEQWVREHPLVAPLCFVLLYTFSTTLSVPGAAFLSVLGGFLFPQPFSTLYVVVGASLGACFLFIAAKTALHDFLKAKAGKFLQSMQAGFHENSVSYLLFLRLVPAFPFWLVNLAPAFFGVSLWTFTWTTFIGIMPGAFVFTQAGAGLGAILDSGEQFSLSSLFNTEIKIALIALGLFALIPIFIRKLMKPKIKS